MLLMYSSGFSSGDWENTSIDLFQPSPEDFSVVSFELAQNQNTLRSVLYFLGAENTRLMVSSCLIFYKGYPAARRN